jgi:hypothetical protein
MSPRSRREKERQIRETFLKFHSCRGFKYKHDIQISTAGRKEKRPRLSAFNPFAGNLIVELLFDHYRGCCVTVDRPPGKTEYATRLFVNMCPVKARCKREGALTTCPGTCGQLRRGSARAEIAAAANWIIGLAGDVP